jgi:hypothetical protein
VSVINILKCEKKIKGEYKMKRKFATKGYKDVINNLGWFGDVKIYKMKEFTKYWMTLKTRLQLI